MLSTTTFNFYQSQQPQILALQSGDVDAIVGIVSTGAQALMGSSQYTIISRKSAGHREFSMRTDLAPFNDPRVRRALALTLDRPAIVKGLLSGRGSVGNDSPFGPRFPVHEHERYLEAPLTSHGVWNAARFKDPTYDRLVKQYVGSVDLQAQRAVAGKIERLLLEQTPVIIPYFLESLTPTKPNVQGTNPTSIGAI